MPIGILTEFLQIPPGMGVVPRVVRKLPVLDFTRRILYNGEHHGPVQESAVCRLIQLKGTTMSAANAWGCRPNRAHGAWPILAALGAAAAMLLAGWTAVEAQGPPRAKPAAGAADAPRATLQDVMDFGRGES
jgi:hypothetical protein